MDRQQIRDRSRFFYGDELQYALKRDQEVDTEQCRDRATMRLVREVGEKELYELCRGTVESIAAGTERNYVVDLHDGQLGFERAIRIADNTLVPVEKARLRDWIAFDEIRERVFQAHAEKRAREREVIAEIIERLGTHGEDATTLAVCSDLFGAREAA